MKDLLFLATQGNIICHAEGKHAHYIALGIITCADIETAKYIPNIKRCAEIGLRK